MEDEPSQPGTGDDAHGVRAHKYILVTMPNLLHPRGHWPEPRKSSPSDHGGKPRSDNDEDEDEDLVDSLADDELREEDLPHG